MRTAFDYVLVGGGLQNALLALALRARRPGARVALVERAESLGGNHTWSFHEGDVPEAAREWVEPLVARRWPSYDVRFPGLERTLRHAYATIPSARVDAVVRERFAGAPGCEVITGSAAVAVGPRVVRLEDGRALEATLVVDARGPDHGKPMGGTGFQKFVGVELRLEKPIAPARPVVMDATVPQADGFRFVYVLPLAEDHVLVEDTYFSDTDLLDRGALRERALDYAREKGLSPFSVVREEEGVLPLPWSGPLPRPFDPPLVAGYAGGFFHPVTGYSFPVAVRLASLVASLPPERALGAELQAFARRHRAQARFAHLLNWLMFRAYPPPCRWHVLERFYREMPEDTIRRFYALDMTVKDRARLLLGRPPRGFSFRLAWAHLQAA
ncbi:MAG TPA: lycopene beta-cyclase CrtY [Vicinamibacteria bacterium]|nr:lycopene beta-cyclase CrtY [Vicinamibacteria bacterium]